MRVFWTLQNQEVWELARERGFLQGDRKHAMFPKEYEWMIHQMKKRVAKYRGEYPIWLWVDKPDLRRTGYFESGVQFVRIKVELDEQDVLLSDYDEWHMVLNNDFLANSEQEYEEYHQGKGTISKEESWERIFAWNRKRDSSWDAYEDRELQGTTGKIDIANVKSVEYFLAR
ncbi:DUF3841 domain-containing protein [Brevibacillus sp. HB1.4B]|uniref:DUF3841 domain-containing protein n=1 Tax=Brevibacillus TaxID=55080 RepID=UPI00035E6C0F|nr:MULTISPECIES: DUF3841 domain-containing protein [unclassified Brevibacillus]ATF14877.1 DUF3841 domain-containing protein [Brevibacillus brevis X23]NRS19357.1 DUF3841 domain-containing protein [Brevibacillus sp. HB1.4B]NTU32918.1 DUF3841 domain-containing protein [Brevibacillus sp. HB1.1]